MQTIVKMRYGSHLYGTATKDSDIDIKAVYLPSARDILLQQIQPVIVTKTQTDQTQKNQAHDVDYDAFSPAKFLSLLAEGQTIALDMIFAPNQFFLEEPSPLWAEIKTIAPRIFNKKAVSFIRYSRQQAYKFGIKGARIAAARQAELIFKKGIEEHGGLAKVGILSDELNALTPDEHLTLGSLENISGEKIQFVEFCGKKVVYTSTLKAAYDLAQRVINEYGARALAAEKNENVDWKALHHAVRIGYEAVEFLATQHITFPRPEAEHLLAIKQGRVDYESVAKEIEDLLEKAEAALAASRLPDDYDQNIIDDFVARVHYQQVMAT